MWRTLATLLGIVVIGLLIVGPVLLVWHWDHELRNFRAVQPGVLYRSGQLSKEGLKRVVYDNLIRTVITLRDAELPGDPPPDLDEETFCKKSGIAHYRLSPAKWWVPNGRPPVDANVDRFRKILDNPANHPILIHCMGGIHRTGTYCAIFRMEYQGWTSAQALEEMVEFGYATLDEQWDVRGYIEEYVPTWRRAGLDHPPPFSARALIRKTPHPEDDAPDF